MIEVTRSELLPGVHLTAVHTKKFKSSVLGLQFLLPLQEETASLNALVPMVLRRGTREHPDLEALSAALDELYGGSLEPMVRKKGETQCVGFLGSFLDDAYTLDGAPLLERAAALLGEVVFHPYISAGAFCPDYTSQEKTNLIDRIRAQINDKRQYAQLRVVEEMCAGERFGVDKLGSEATAAAIDCAALWTRYQEMLRLAPVELYYCGSAAPERVRQALSAILAELPQGAARTAPGRPARRQAPDVPRLVEEAMDVTQGKLGMGFACGSDDRAAVLMGNTLFGGSSNSKLFLNVREKLSLCYYASSNYHRQKRIITVSSGIEFQNYQKAYDEIMAQLAAVQAGRLEDWELEGARSTLLNAYASMGDSQGKLENFYLGQAATGQEDTPELLAEQVRQVTAERIFDAMQTVSLDTVYFLKGKEAAE